MENANLIVACYEGNHSIDENECFDETNVYKVEDEDGNKVVFWNSNNRSRIDKEYILKIIARLLKKGDVEGMIDEPYAMVQVMWEVK